MGEKNSGLRFVPAFAIKVKLNKLLDLLNQPLIKLKTVNFIGAWVMVVAEVGVIGS